MYNTLAPSTVVTHRSPKGLKFMSIVEAQYDKARMGEDEAQLVNDTPGLAEIIATFITENRRSNKYINEEIESTWTYVSGYSKPKGLIAQCNRLRELFPGIGFANMDFQKVIEESTVALPEGAEGWFAIPNWVVLEIFGRMYSGAVQKILDTLKQARDGKFYNWRDGQIDENHLRQSVRTIEFWQNLSESQNNPDILIVPAQFGLRHRGRSTRRATKVFRSDEFGLGSFAVGCMLLTHPERLQRYEDLCLDATGDEFNDDPVSNQRCFAQAPFFSFRDDKLRFGVSFVDFPLGSYGSASGFFPQ